MNRRAVHVALTAARLLLVLLLACGVLSAGGDGKGTQDQKVPVVPPAKGKTEVIQLFNNKDLEGWVGHKDLWSVQEGILIARNQEPVSVSTYLLTRRKFRDFRLTLSAKLVASDMHSGVAFWGKVVPEKGDPHTYKGVLVMFPQPWGMFDLYGRELLPVDPKPSAQVGKQKDWNDIEILAQGNRVRVAINGKQVIDWLEPEPERIQEAPIGLQLHSNKVPQEIHFKDVMLTTHPESILITTK